jgi:uncharacterized protein YkwD
VVAITAAVDGYRLVTDIGALLAPGDHPAPVRPVPATVGERTSAPVARSQPRTAAPPATLHPTTTTSPPAAPVAVEGVGPAMAVAAAAAESPAGIVTGEQVAAAVDAVRAQRGLGPLAWDANLASFASSWSASMVTTGLHHRDLSSILSSLGGHTYVQVGEVLYAGGGDSASAVVDAWMASPTHRAEILNASFDRVGVGVATGGGRAWITADLGDQR